MDLRLQSAAARMFSKDAPLNAAQLGAKARTEWALERAGRGLFLMSNDILIVLVIQLDTVCGETGW